MAWNISDDSRKAVEVYCRVLGMQASFYRAQAGWSASADAAIDFRMKAQATMQFVECIRADCSPDEAALAIREHHADPLVDFLADFMAEKTFDAAAGRIEL